MGTVKVCAFIVWCNTYKEVFGETDKYSAIAFWTRVFQINYSIFMVSEE